MPDRPRRFLIRMFARPLALTVLGLGLITPPSVQAGKLSWLDDVVRQAVREAEAGARVAARGAERPTATVARASGRLFAREADEALTVLARRHDDLARAGRRSFATASDALLEARFARLVRPDSAMARTFKALGPAEKRMVVEMSETAQRLARRYPGQADVMIRRLGSEGLSAVRVFGDDVAPILAREGPQSINVLRKTGRGGWAFFTETVLPHKTKLAAAGVLAVFLANPDWFVDTAGNVTEYAVREFAKAGINLAGTVGGAAARGMEDAIGQTLAAHGLNSAAARYLGMGLAGLVVVLATMVLVGLPVAWVVRPFARLGRLVRPRRPAKAV